VNKITYIRQNDSSAHASDIIIMTV